MTNLFSYVRKYGNFDFKTKLFSEVDNLVFSLLSYLDYTNTSINDNKHTLKFIGKQYLDSNKYKDIKKLGNSQKNAYKLLEKVIKTNRYKNIIISDYVYKVDDNKQFSAMSFKINNNLKYICFEGTDELVSGWKEDGLLACSFPVPSHIEAINYVNKHIKLFGPDIIIGGHSKGGNLALVSAMFMKNYKKFKVKKIYNNDGPGLRKEEFERKEFKELKNKYLHIIPQSSFVGIMLESTNYKVIKSSKKSLLSHSLTTWIIDDDKLIETTLSEKSKRFEHSLANWINMHDYDEIKKIVLNSFKILEDSGITVINKIKKLKNIIKIFKYIKGMDAEFKKLTKDLITYNFINTKGLKLIKKYSYDTISTIKA